MLTGPTSTPSPMRPTRPRSDSSSSSSVRVKTSRSTGPSTPSRAARRSRARSTRSAAFCSVIGQRVPMTLGAEEFDEAPTGPGGALGPRSRRRRLVEIVDDPEHELAQRARSLRLGPQLIGPPLRSVRIALTGLGLAVAVDRVGGEQAVPVGTSRHHTRFPRDPFPGDDRARRPRWRGRPPANQAKISSRR